MAEVICSDCGAEYESLGCDLVLPDQQWKIICPEGGILCANCICQRASKLSATVILAWVVNLNYNALTTPEDSSELSGTDITCSHPE
jgi:hypothetical protein